MSQSGTLIFPSGTTTQEIRVPIVGDLRFEFTESFNVNLTNPVGSNIRDGNALGTITDNDARPTLSINDPTSPGRNSGTANRRLHGQPLRAPSGLPVIAELLHGRLLGDRRHRTTPTVTGRITFAPGETSKTISVPILADSDTGGDRELPRLPLRDLQRQRRQEHGPGLHLAGHDAAPLVPFLAVQDVDVVEGDRGDANTATFR